MHPPFNRCAHLKAALGCSNALQFGGEPAAFTLKFGVVTLRLGKLPAWHQTLFRELLEIAEFAFQQVKLILLRSRLRSQPFDFFVGLPGIQLQEQLTFLNPLPLSRMVVPPRMGPAGGCTASILTALRSTK